MANVVGDIAIAIGADIGPLVRDLGRAKGEVSAFGATAQTAAGGGMRAWSVAGAAMAGAAVTAGLGLVALTKQAIDNGSAMHDASIQTGVHVAALQAMAQVAGEAGVASEALIGSLSKMSNSIAGLQVGTKAQVEAFGSLGLAMEDLQGLAPDEQFAVIARAIDGISDPARQTAAAMDIFGKSGASLIPMMDGYAAALDEVAQKQRDLGIAMSDEEAAKMDAMGDSMGRITLALQGLGTQLAIAFGPATVATINAMTQAIEGWELIFERAADLVTTSNIEAVGATIGDMSKAVTDELEGMAGALNNMDFAFAAENMKMLTASFQAGGMTVDEYRTRLEIARSTIVTLIETAAKASDLDMAGSIENMNGYIGVLLQAVGLQAELANTAPVAIPALNGPAGGPASMTEPSSLAPGSSMRPGQKGVDFDFGGSTGGGGGGGGPSLADQLAELQDGLKSQAEIEQAAYEERQATLDAALAAKLLSQEQYAADAEALQAQHQDAMRAIDRYTYGDGLMQTDQFLGDMADALASGNEEMLRVSKMFGAAQALISAWQGAAESLKLPFPANLGAFASVLATGLGAVAAIKGVTSSGGGSTGGGSAPAGGGSAPAAGGYSSSAGSSSPLQVSLSGLNLGDMFSGAQLSSLLNSLNAEAGDRGYTILVPA